MSSSPHTPVRPRILGVASLLATLLLVSAASGTAAAGSPTCANLDGFAVVHGQHITRDYVTGGALGNAWPPTGLGQLIASEGAVVPGGPGPGFHFAHGVAPGASFCVPQAQSPGFHVPQ